MSGSSGVLRKRARRGCGGPLGVAVVALCAGPLAYAQAPRQQTQGAAEAQTPQPSAEQSAGQPAEQSAPGQQVGQTSSALQTGSSANGCAALPAHGDLATLLEQTVTPGDPQGNGGLGNHMWAVVVDRFGTVCAVARSGGNAGDQWVGSRGIAASKAYTAVAFSLDGFALSTANLYRPSQPGGTLYGLDTANPMSPFGLYNGDPRTWGTPDDPLVARRVGGVTVFAGGLALYSPDGLVGGIGVSGDESCTDHIVAWKLRFSLGFDAVPNGPSPSRDDNIIHDLTVDPGTGELKSRSGYGHPNCSARAQQIASRFDRTMPAGPAADGASSAER